MSPKRVEGTQSEHNGSSSGQNVCTGWPMWRRYYVLPEEGLIRGSLCRGDVKICIQLTLHFIVGIIPARTALPGPVPSTSNTYLCKYIKMAIKKIYIYDRGGFFRFEKEPLHTYSVDGGVLIM